MPTPTETHLCHGCDTELGADKFCASCGETMQTYAWDGMGYRAPTRIERLLAKSADHDAASPVRIAALAPIRAELSAILEA